MTDAKRVFIRDPIHGYIELTEVEQTVVGHRVTQRLRNIMQNGLAHLVFPEARTSRFSHSLGAMNFASLYLASSLRNASDAAVARFVREVKRTIVLRSLGKTSDLDCCQPLLSKALTSPGVVRDDESRITLAAIEQGLRLAALFHDLGHLPFSHDFEEALQSYWRSLDTAARQSAGLKWLFVTTGGPAPQPHEQVAHKLAELVLKELFGEQPQEHARIAFESGLRILNAPEPALDRSASALEWLKSLIAGELDSDRADYLLRDGRAFGFEFGAYDSQRLFENVVLIKTKDRGYETVVRDKALTALESYYLARTRSHQHLAARGESLELDRSPESISVPILGVWRWVRNGSATVNGPCGSRRRISRRAPGTPSMRG